MTPRFWRRAAAATVLMLLALVGTSALGLWQYSVAHRGDAAAAVAKLPTAALADRTEVGEYLAESDYGRLATLNAVVDCDRGFLAGEKAPYWVVCPAELGDSLAAVVVGTTAGELPRLPEAAELALSGRLQPSQDTAAPVAVYPTPAPTIVDLIGTAEMTLRWQRDVRDGFLVADEATATAFGLPAVATAGLAYPPTGIELRNLFYAWQWWLFAAFAIFLWGRYVRDEWRLVHNDPVR